MSTTRTVRVIGSKVVATSLGPARPGDELELPNGEWREMYERGEVEPVGSDELDTTPPKKKRLRKKS